MGNSPVGKNAYLNCIFYIIIFFSMILVNRRGKGGTVVEHLLPTGRGSNAGVNTICGLSLLLVLSLARRGFSPGTLVFPLDLECTDTFQQVLKSS